VKREDVKREDVKREDVKRKADSDPLSPLGERVRVRG